MIYRKTNSYAFLRKLFDRYYAEAAEEGSFLFPAVADTLGALHAKGLPLALVTNKTNAVRGALARGAGYREIL